MTNAQIHPSSRPSGRAACAIAASARRHLVLLAYALAAVACLTAPHQAIAQAKTEPPAVQPKQPPAQPKQPPAAPEFVVPSAEGIVVLIRSTLLSLNDALHTGNYTVLRDLASPSFREANSAGRLVQIFSSLAAQRIDLTAVAILAPKLPNPPAIDQNRRLRITGFFPGEPVQINFDLTFEAVANQWRLFGISVNPAKSASADATPAASPSPPPPADKKKPPPQPGKP